LGLIEGQNNIDGIEIPPYVSHTFASLACPNYIYDLLNWAPTDTNDTAFPEYIIITFQRIWSEVLENEQSQKISVLEPACGSANDYRFLASFGAAKFLNYSGFDLCTKNITNAKHMFPDVFFNTGNVLEIQAEDKSFDYCFLHDLFEHFSIEAMELAVKEICRVTRKGICTSFFNMHDEKEHIIKTVHDYHWNRLSMTAMVNLFKKYFDQIKVIHIDSFLTSHFSCNDTQNKNAYTFIIS
jgi:ubiquinone/menaquinone biosynthesis C-methylase UbiE